MSGIDSYLPHHEAYLFSLIGHPDEICPPPSLTPCIPTTEDGQPDTNAIVVNAHAQVIDTLVDMVNESVKRADKMHYELQEWIAKKWIPQQQELKSRIAMEFGEMKDFKADERRKETLQQPIAHSTLDTTKLRQI